MCGIAGYATFDPRATVDTAHLRAMLSCLSHRGPDDEGEFVDQGVVLGHRRLSVIDVAGGHQPLYGARPSTVVICNGEIYNYRELARQLRARGHQFRTASDTEVAAHAYDEWGPDFLDKLDGMFALVLWDGAARRLILARDRLGEKPLYYTRTEQLFLFASELTALLKHPDVDDRLDYEALSEYLALEYTAAPRTILQNARKLEPGCALTLENGSLRHRRYWAIRPQGRLDIDYTDAVLVLREKLDAAVSSRLVSDVPLGIFLSGGLDSSTIAALAARHGALETFSIGFREKSFDESDYARTVAQHIGSRHHERIFRGEEMAELVPRLPAMLDEPLGDASILPTALLSAFAREHVTVALGGDGGDELFAGYPMHQAHRLARVARLTPTPIRSLTAAAAGALPVKHTNFALPFKVLTFLKGAGAPAPFNHALWMSSFAPREQLQLLTPEAWLRAGEGREAYRAVLEAWQRSEEAQPIARATHLDAVTYLPNDILMKVDRASMRVALEVRAPFLAREVTEFAFSLPDAFRMRGTVGKRLLKDAARLWLPEQIIDRPKKGFGIPVAAWLNGPLRPLVQDVLAPDALKRGGLFNPKHVQGMLRAHASRQADLRKPLWTLFVFELWRQHHLAGRTAGRTRPGVKA
ncbi:MAG TPA: asparagine synthase (glutamine-hydrolyzing) [Longimicrobiales bacterium]